MELSFVIDCFKKSAFNLESTIHLRWRIIRPVTALSSALTGKSWKSFVQSWLSGCGGKQRGKCPSLAGEKNTLWGILRVSIENRTGESSIIVLDGDSLSVLAKTDVALLYDQADQPGDVDYSLEYLNKVLGTNDQIRDFFSIELMTRLRNTIESGLYLSESKVAGTVCEHLALRTDALDVQVWIPKTGQPVPVRMVATYREIEGQPHFWADFIEWDFSPNFGPDFFEFTPPESAKQVDFFESD